MSAPGKDGDGDRKPPLPRPTLPVRGASGTMQPRQPSNTHSLLPSRSASGPQRGGPRIIFRPVRPEFRNSGIKPDPDDPSRRMSPPLPSSTYAGPSRPPPSSTSAGPSRPPRKPLQRQPIVMTASGPFSFVSSAPKVKNSGKSRIFQPSQMEAGTLSKLEGGSNTESGDRLNYKTPDEAGKMQREQYSDPEDDGVEIVDMEDVGRLDSNAPISLPRMKGKEKGKKKTGNAVRVKREISATRENGVDIDDGDIELEEAEKDEGAQNADALDLSASEDEEVMDNLLEDFVGDEDGENPENRLYLFQFPPLFPKFDLPASAVQQPITRKRSVVFAEDTVGGGGAAGVAPKAQEERVKSETGVDDKTSAEDIAPTRHEGQIGRLDVYRDGRVNFRFNDIVMELTGGSQSSFLQQVMILDGDQCKATTLGELHRKFVVSPEIESMLNDVNTQSETVEVTDDDE